MPAAHGQQTSGCPCYPIQRSYGGWLGSAVRGSTELAEVRPQNELVVVAVSRTGGESKRFDPSHPNHYRSSLKLADEHVVTLAALTFRRSRRQTGVVWGEERQDSACEHDCRQGQQGPHVVVGLITLVDQPDGWRAYQSADISH